MDFMPISALIFQSIPESFAVILLGLALTRTKFSWLKLILISILSALGAFFIRAMPIKYGINIIIEIPYLILLMKIFFQLNIKRAMLIAAVSLISLGFAEGLTLPIISLVSGISAQEAISNTFLRIIIPLPQNLILLIVGFYCYKKDIYIFDEDFLQR